MIRHHPSPELLTDYARGALHRGVALVMACHLDCCMACRREVLLWESVGGAMLEDIAPEPLAHESLQTAMANLDKPLKAAARKFPRHLEHYAVPRPLRHARIGLRRWVTPAIWFAPVPSGRDEKSRTYLVYSARGITMPAHTHSGHEFTQVLHGQFTDPLGTFAQGDFAQTDETVGHAPAISCSSGCLCLISSDAPMQMIGRSARVAQWLLGTMY